MGMMMRRANLIEVKQWLFFAMVFPPLQAMAEQAVRPSYAPPPPVGISAGSMVQMVLSLLLVLGAVVLVAWLLKRVNLPQHAAGNLMQIKASVAVGQRERIVLMEVNDTWLVIGVAPGQVSALHTMPKAEMAAMLPADTQHSSTEQNKFQGWLKEILEKRNAR